MSSILSSRYWTCPCCFQQFDWQADRESKNHPENHDVQKCRSERAAKEAK